MPQKPRDSRIENRSNRLKLMQDRFFWKSIEKGFSIGYRRRQSNAGSWCVRTWDSGEEKYQVSTLGAADDYQDGNGVSVLTYAQALHAAIEFRENRHKRHAAKALGVNPDLTVEEAIQQYLEWYPIHGNRGRGGKDLSGVTRRAELHILPTLGHYKVVDVTYKKIKDWFLALPASPALYRAGGKGRKVKQNVDLRARKSTSNKVLAVLKAALNLSFQDGHVETDSAWRRVKPFRDVDQPKVRYLETDECTRLTNACRPDIRSLVQAALFTGCRYGELANMKAGDFSKTNGSVFIAESKSGKPRHVHLSDDGLAFFERMVLGKAQSEHIFFRSNGQPWKKSDQIRPMKEASEAARINPPISFHILRHTYASHLVMNGASLRVVADLLGHADIRITQRHYAHLAPSFVADVVRASLPTLGNIENDNVVSIKAG